MTQALLVAAGGAIGSLTRYLVGLWALRAFGPAFPWGTLGVNVVGSFAIGLFGETILRRFGGSELLRLLLVTGFLGGFTTFSAFSLDVAVLVERGAMVPAFAYVAVSMLVSLFAVFAGLALVRALL